MQHLNRGHWRTAAIGTFATMSLTGLLAMGGSVRAQTASFADPAFQAVWQRTDAPVAEGTVSRTWVWGPTPGRSLQEPFAGGPGGSHLVQYFDKARMEINDPSGDPSDPFYVTNGLLVVEMISGNMQTGANSFSPLSPSDVQIAGDSGSDSPSYAALQNVASVGLAGKDNRALPVVVGSNMPVVYINKAGQLSSLGGRVAPQGIKAAGFVNETGHNIADVFMTYFNSTGPVYENGVIVNGPIVNWISAFGYPITEPYWTTIRVAGQDRLILIQAFQRRILTFSPQNDEGWKVEMGNVGAQYYTWRYETAHVVCDRVPLRGFGTVWSGHSSVKAGVGCPQTFPPFDRETAVQTAYQEFEHGSMLWISRTTYTQERLIYVFFDDGTFQQFDDTWRDGDPPNGNMTPPPGRYEPQRGFGKVWREGTGAQVRDRLGWATILEKGGDGAYQRFQYGEMYWSATINKIWVLYGTVSGVQYPAPTPVGGAQPLRYELYDNTY
ncbi:MAG TPA: hypothetical protein VLQ48_02625 [Chloroflexia bacterium]|nr:hypothetical protein [Chloroflexia bacterium]